MLFWFLRTLMLWIALGMSIQNTFNITALEKEVKRLRAKLARKADRVPKKT